MEDKFSSEMKERSRGNYQRFLTFYLDDEIYGVAISDVKEIIAFMKTTKIPKMPKYFKGVMNLRGIIIPVIDMRLKFGLEESQYTMHTAIIIIQISGVSVGFIVDRVEEVLPINKEDITDPPSFGSKVDNDYIKKMAKSGEDVVMILNLEELLTQHELDKLENASII